MKEKQNKKGFTLAELLIVVAIIAVLVAISIPIFTSQLEKTREATDAANIRSQYAQVMTEAITSGGDVDGKALYGAVELKQKKDKWQSNGLKTNLEGVYGQIVGDYPKAGGTAWVEYRDEKVILHYEGGSDSGGSDSGGGSDDGGNTEPTSNDPAAAYDNVKHQGTDWPAQGTKVNVTRGEIISYNGTVYVSATTRSWDMNQWWYTTPDIQHGDFYSINDKAAQTDADLQKPYQGSDKEELLNLSIGDLYQDSENHYYVYIGGSSNNMPPSQDAHDWIPILSN
jgi:prepilin-type N-terminal cleavage/methylation domain-containing protein